MAAETLQIPPSIVVIVAGLAGSILTIATGKAIDLIQKRQEHKYSLQKAFFEKRLQVAETLVGNMRRTVDFLETASTVIKSIPDHLATNKSREILKTRMKALASQAQAMEQQTKEGHYAAPLYFDTERLDRVSSLCNEKISNLFLMIGLLETTVQTIGNDKPTREDLETVSRQFGELHKDILTTLESVRAAMVNFVANLRDEMKVYGSRMDAG